MEQSILITTKKVLGLEAGYTPFDVDILLHINSAFSTLVQIGVDPLQGFFVDDETSTWEEIDAPTEWLNLIRTYVFLKVRMLFDPPTTSFLLEANSNQLKEYEWRINVFREGELWTTPA